MSVIPQTPELPGVFAPPPLVPRQGSALDPLGTLIGPQTPRLLTPPPLTTNPGSAPDDDHRGVRGRYRMVVRIISSYGIGSCHYISEFELSF